MQLCANSVLRRALWDRDRRVRVQSLSAQWHMHRLPRPPPVPVSHRYVGRRPALSAALFKHCSDRCISSVSRQRCKPFKLERCQDPRPGPLWPSRCTLKTKGDETLPAGSLDYDTSCPRMSCLRSQSDLIRPMSHIFWLFFFYYSRWRGLI